jgi:hypothetical protein
MRRRSFLCLAAGLPLLPTALSAAPPRHSLRHLAKTHNFSEVTDLRLDPDVRHDAMLHNFRIAYGDLLETMRRNQFVLVNPPHVGSVWVRDTRPRSRSASGFRW